MDSTDEEFYGSTTSFTTKGRRTKRQRTTNTNTATATTTSSYGGCIEISYGSSASATPSPSTPDDRDIISQRGIATEEEDLDMANCLILLAQGSAKKTRSSEPKYNNNINNTNNSSTGVTASTAVIGVYECKTCNKTFSSFQALGGHRTSHKKIIPKPPKPAENLDSPDFLPIPPPKEAPEKPNANTNRNNPEKSSSTTRVHECTICGAEFSSGQALGGHMRRHRPIVNNHSTTAIVVNEDGPIMEVGQEELGGPRTILSLDLNLPAPNEHEHEHEHDRVVLDGSTNSTSHVVETKFNVVIPTPALLDCHY